MTQTQSQPHNAPAKQPGWKPNIVAFVCNWCTYAGADMAGTTRLEYPASIRMLRVPCTGRMSPLFVLKAFEQGADGVLLSGCHPGDCHYVQGNYFARRRFAAFRALLDFMGLDPKRLHFSWVSAAEAQKWARVVRDVTKRVTEAGPLPIWGGLRLNGKRVEVPARPAAPRQTAPAAEQDAVAGHLRGLVESLIKEGKVSTLIGYRRGTLPGQMVPAFIRAAEDAKSLGWSDQCFTNLATYLAGNQRQTGKLGLVVKACDAKAVAELLQETQVKRENLTLVGVSCPGVFERGELASKCYACNGEVASICDFTVTAAGVKPGAVASGAKRATGPDPRDIQVKHLLALAPDQRRAFWDDQFADCIRCYGCRAACPMCYCGTCIVEKTRPQWIPTTTDGKGNTAWNFIRAYHLAGRCVGCDECARVCPSGLALDLINRRVAMEIEERFGVKSGKSEGKTDGAPPLAAFQPDDPQEFIY